MTVELPVLFGVAVRWEERRELAVRRWATFALEAGVPADVVDRACDELRRAMWDMAERASGPRPLRTVS